jgi:hypothetical protein
MELYLDSRDTELLMDLMARRLEALRREIHHTDTAAFRDRLRAEEARLQSLLTKLSTPAEMGI